MATNRKTPVLNIDIEGDVEEGFEMLLKSPQIKEVVLAEVVKAVTFGIDKNKKEIELFKINQSNYVVTIKVEQWKPSLDRALEYYVEKEEWDECIKCRDLIHKL